MADISGTVLLPTNNLDWEILAYDGAIGELAGVADVINSSYTISGLKTGNYFYLLTLKPKLSNIWKTNKFIGSYEYCIPSNTQTTPYVFKANNVSDPNDANIIIESSFTGLDNSTTLTDLKGNATYTVSTGAKIVTADSLSGTGSLKILKTIGGFAEITPISLSGFSTFTNNTIEFWIKWLSNSYETHKEVCQC